MKWPLAGDYSDAMQNPRLALLDASLACGSVAVGAMGVPRCASGNYAVVFRLETPSATWAIKCFTRQADALQQRYGAISAHLAKAGLDCTVGFEYMERGIRVQGNVHPIVKMQWVSGVPLDRWISSHLTDRDALERMADKWVEMLTRLRSHSIGHGDLQGGNVLVVGDRLTLIDYDGMYVPALRGLTAEELGHANYQPPTRTASDFASYVDYFSGWLVYASLLAVRSDPSLWHRHRGGDDCLLLRQGDIASPWSSAALSEMLASKDSRVRHAAGILQGHAQSPLSHVPALDRASQPASPTGQSGATSALPDWVQQERRPQGASAMGRQRPVSARAGVAQPVVPPFRSVRLARILTFLTTALLALIGVGLHMYVGVDVGLALAAAAGAIATCTGAFASALYRRESAVALRRKAVDRVKSRQANIATINARVGAVQRDLEGAASKGSAAATRRDAELRAADEALRQAQAKENARAADEIRVLTQERAVLDGQESAERRDLASRYDAQVTAARSLAKGRHDQLASDLARALAEQKAQLLRGYLAQHVVGAGVVDGIGPELAERLRAAGISSAADAERWRVSNVRGIGEKKARALDRWRSGIAAQYAQYVPTSLHAGEDARIRSAHAAGIREAEARADALARESDGATRACAARWAAARSASDRKLADARGRSAATVSAAQKQRDERVQRALLTHRTEEAAFRQAQTKCAQETSALEQQKQQESGLLVADEAALRQFAGVTFGKYCARVLGAA